MKLLFAAFVVYLHLQMISAIVDFVPEDWGSRDCNYAVFTDEEGVTGYRESLGKCLVSDLYHLSFKFVLDEATKESQEVIYHNTDCTEDAENPATYHRGAIPTSVKTDSKNSCETFSYVYAHHYYDTTSESNERIKTDGLEIDEEETETASGHIAIVKGSKIRMASLLFGDCMNMGPVWLKQSGCDYNVDGKEGNDVITQQIYSDDKCTQELSHETYYDLFFKSSLNVMIQVQYTKFVKEGEPSRIYRRKDTKVKWAETTPYDVVCYKQAPLQTQNVPYRDPQPLPEPQPQRPQAQFSKMHMDLFSNYHDKPKPQLQVYNKPQLQHPLYDAPQQVIYDGPQAPDYDSNWWSYLAVNVLVSMVCTLCVIATCLTAYYYMHAQNKSVYSPVQWTKEEDTDV